jgi:predicted Holliday junction resolvase-like endonuclease
MSTLLIISAVIVLGIVILKLLNEVSQLKNKLGNLQEELNKKVEIDDVNKNQVQITSTTSDITKSITKNKRITSSSKVVKPKSKEQETLDDNKSINETPSLNPFLYNAADFGEMKKGVVIENITYTYDKKDEDDSFEINPITKEIN